MNSIEIFNIEISTQMFWLIVMVLCGILEGITLGITSIWFVFGALAALVASFVIDSVIIQVVLFIVVSILLLIFTKPLAIKYLKVGSEKNTLNQIIGKEAIVLEEIDNINGTGQVKIGGIIWSAISSNGKNLPKDSIVVVVEIKGVKVIVKGIDKEI